MSQLHETVESWLEHNMDRMVGLVAGREQLLVRGDAASQVGSEGRAKLEQAARCHLEYLESAVRRRSQRLFRDYVAWAKVLSRHQGKRAQDFKTSLEIARDVVAVEAPLALRSEILAPLQQTLEQFDSLPEELDSVLSPLAPHAGLARRYLDLMLAGRRQQAVQCVLDAAKQGVSVRDIYLHVFQPVQHEIGRLWQINEVTVAQEHYCTAITQLTVAQLYPYVFSGAPKGRVLVATCIAGDLHEVGVRMIADFFEMDGWDTHYLGANVPLSGIVETVRERKADLVAVSATIAKHVEGVAQLIAQLHAHGAASRVPIMVGGHPFNVDRELWRRVGADGCAADADGAVALGNSLVEKAA